MQKWLEKWNIGTMVSDVNIALKYGASSLVRIYVDVLYRGTGWQNFVDLYQTGKGDVFQGCPSTCMSYLWFQERRPGSYRYVCCRGIKYQLYH